MSNLVRFDPFNVGYVSRGLDIKGYHSSLWNDFFDGVRTFTPSVDVAEDEHGFVIKVEIPGYSKDDVNVEFENGVLKISAEHNEEKEEKNERYHVRERRTGSFGRKFTLPENVDSEKITAAAKDGILTVNVPKLELEEPKPVRIQVNQ